MATNLKSILDGPSLAFKNQTRRRRRNRPESGRRARASFALGATIADPTASFDVSAPNLFGCDIVFLAGEEGVIFDAGSASIGALVAVYNDQLIIRAGNGAAPTNDATARVSVPISRLLNAQRVRLSWFISPSASLPLVVKAWVNGRVIGSSSSVLPSASWADAGAGGYDNPQSPLPSEPDENIQTYSSSAASLIGPLFNYEGRPTG